MCSGVFLLNDRFVIVSVNTLFSNHKRFHHQPTAHAATEETVKMSTTEHPRRMSLRGYCRLFSMLDVDTLSRIAYHGRMDSPAIRATCKTLHAAVECNVPRLRRRCIKHISIFVCTVEMLVQLWRHSLNEYRLHDDVTYTDLYMMTNERLSMMAALFDGTMRLIVGKLERLAWHASLRIPLRIAMDALITLGRSHDPFIESPFQSHLTCHCWKREVKEFRQMTSSHRWVPMKRIDLGSDGLDDGPLYEMWMRDGAIDEKIDPKQVEQQVVSLFGDHAQKWFPLL